MPKPAKNVVDPLKPLLAQLTPSRIEKLGDVQVKSAVDTAVALAAGVQTAYSGSGPAQAADVARLDEVGITPAKLLPLVQAAVALVAAAEDRDQKASAYHQAVAQVQQGCGGLESSVVGFAARLRGSFGTTSSDLKRFGVTPLGGGHGGGRKKKQDSGSKSNQGNG